MDTLSDDAPIEIVAHDPGWESAFQAERTLLQRVLEPWLRGPIEQIGSTAVPGLAAKPVIDIMAGVGSLEESAGAISAVGTLGYLYAPYRPDVMHWFCKPRRSFRTHHLQLVPHGGALWHAALIFRDRLREDANVAEEYVKLKQRLASAFRDDREAYTNGKTEFVARIVGEALKQKTSG